MRWLPILSAIVLPVVLLGAGVVIVSRDTGDTTAAPRPGLHTPTADILVIGNSKVDTDLDMVSIARTFDVEPERVWSMSLHGTGAAAWLASLEFGVYAGGNSPKVVLVYASPARMLQVKPLGARETQRVEALLATGEADAVSAFRARISGGTLSLWRTRASARKDHLIERLRDTAVGLLFDFGPGLAERGKAVATPALAEVFPVGVGTQKGSAVPIKEGETTQEEVAPADSLVPDLIRLIRSHGAQAVFVPAPVGPTFYTTEVGAFRDDLPALVELVHAEGGAWVDIDPKVLPASAYRDAMHMRPSGRSAFAPILQDALVAAGAPGPITGQPWHAPRPPVAGRRIGASAPIPLVDTPKPGSECTRTVRLDTFAELSSASIRFAGHGTLSPVDLVGDGEVLPTKARPNDVLPECSRWSIRIGRRAEVSAPKGTRYELRFRDDAPLVDAAGLETWWVTPGTTLEFELPDDVGAISIHGLAAGPAGAVEASRGEGPRAPLDRVGGVVSGVVPAGTGPLRIRAAADGPAVLLERVETTLAEGPWYIVGGRATAYAASLFGTITAETPAPPLDTEDRPVEPARMAGKWFVSLGELVSLTETSVHTKSGAVCSPLLLATGGAPFDAATWTVAARKVQYDVLAKTPGATPPATARFVYNPDRSCHGADAAWVYPGDRLRIAPPPIVPTFTHPVARLRLAGVPFQPVGRSTWRLLRDGAPLATGTVEAAEWAAPILRPLPTPLLYPAPGIELEIELESGLLLLTAAELTEAG